MRDDGGQIHSYDERLDQFLREEARNRHLNYSSGYSWMERLRRQLRTARILGYDQDAVAAEIFYLLVCRPGTLWGYQADYGTTLEQRWSAYVDARVKDVLRARARRDRALPAVPWEDTLEVPRTGPGVDHDPGPLDPGDPQVVEFRGWLVGQRRGAEMVRLFDLRIAGRGIEETMEVLGISRDYLATLTEDLRHYLGVYGQRYPEIAEALAGVERRERVEGTPRPHATVRCYVGGEHPVEVRVVGKSRVHGLTKVKFLDGSEGWVHPLDLLVVAVRSEQRQSRERNGRSP
jgi:hypothetical protein